MAPSGARKTTQRLHCDSSESSTFSPRARAVRATQSLARGHHFLSSTGSLFVCRAGIAHALGRLERPSEKPGAVLTRVRVRGTAKKKNKKIFFFFFSLSPESTSNADSIIVSVQSPAVCSRMHPQGSTSLSYHCVQYFPLSKQ